LFHDSSLDLAKKSSGEVEAVGLLRNNQLETFTINNAPKQKSRATDNKAAKQKDEKYNSKRLFLPGHRSECRSACFTSDGLAILTAAAQSAKLWNR